MRDNSVDHGSLIIVVGVKYRSASIAILSDKHYGIIKTLEIEEVHLTSTKSNRQLGYIAVTKPEMA